MNNLPLTETLSPSNAEELAEAVRKRFDKGTPVYPIGGGTGQTYGLAPKRQGTGLAMTGLARVVDYPARDMTVTVEAGMRMAALAELLAKEGQWLPVDAPHPAEATLGGVIATNTSGPRRYGCGSIRDYVIGISAVDGRGEAFKAGGRVVKNVAGYDFCKLLVGSLGTLGVITQLTLKVVPRPAASRMVACNLDDWEGAERRLAALVTSRTTPVAICLASGPAWERDEALAELPPRGIGQLMVGLEGSAAEATWLVRQLLEEWKGDGGPAGREVPPERVAGLWERLTAFPTVEAPLVLKFSVPPARIASMAQSVLAIDAGASLLLHTGSGCLLARFSQFTPADVSKVLIGKLQPSAAAAGGSVVVVSSTLSRELTRQVVWGPARSDYRLMLAVREQFDPKGILNPGRFVFE
jgi:glycolate oxidase FAD binding subunit